MDVINVSVIVLNIRCFIMFIAVNEKVKVEHYFDEEIEVNKVLFFMLDFIKMIVNVGI